MLTYLHFNVWRQTDVSHKKAFSWNEVLFQAFFGKLIFMWTGGLWFEFCGEKTKTDA